MTTLPTIRTKVGSPVGVDIYVSIPSLDGYEKSYFDADEAIGQTALSANGANFAVDQYVVLGQVGAEKTEIVKLHASTAPTATVITTGTTVFAHNRGDKIQFIPWNQIVVERSTDAGVNFTPLTAVDIRPDATETYIQRTGDASTDVYRVRLYNSTSTLYSAYSDQTTASGYADNSVYSIKRRALQDMGEKVGEVITDELLNASLWEGRREIDQDPRILRWPFRIKMDEDIGDVIPGRYSLTLPTDLRTPYSNLNILSVRIGRNNNPLTYIGKVDFNNRFLYVAHSTLNGAITSASTSIILTNSGEFAESGSVDIAAESVSGSIDNAAYTTNTESTNTLGTVTSIADSHSTLRDVWQGVSFGMPTHYTIDADSGKILFDVPFADDYKGENIFMDYYGELVAYNSDADILDEPEYDLFVSYLKWKIEHRLSNGKLKPTESGNYLEWTKRKDDLITKQHLGMKVQFVPGGKFRL